jgi:hypothetical protein
MDHGLSIILGQENSIFFFGPFITLRFSFERKQQLDALQQREQDDALQQREQLCAELYSIKKTIVQPEYKTLVTRGIRRRVRPTKNRTFVILSPPQFQLLTIASSTYIEGIWAFGIHIQGWIQDFWTRYDF